MEAFFRGSQTINSVTCGFRRSYSQAAEVPSSNVTCKSPRRPSIHCRIMLAFVSMTHSITIFPAAFITAIEMLSLCTSIPIYLVLVIKGVLSEWVEPNTQNPTPKGAPFYIVGKPFIDFICAVVVSRWRVAMAWDIDLTFIIMYIKRVKDHNYGHYMRTSRSSVLLPIPVRHALRKLGHDLRDARRRRRIPVAIAAQRASI